MVKFMKIWQRKKLGKKVKDGQRTTKTGGLKVLKVSRDVYRLELDLLHIIIRF